MKSRFAKKFYEKRICVNCKKEFFVVKKKSREVQRPPHLRPRFAKNCSPKCSKEYERSRWKRDEKKN